jgi:hypothetical protein
MAGAPRGSDLAASVWEEIDEKASAQAEMIDDIILELESGDITLRQASQEVATETAKVNKLQQEFQEKIIIVSDIPSGIILLFKTPDIVTEG